MPLVEQSICNFCGDDQLLVPSVAGVVTSSSATTAMETEDTMDDRATCGKSRVLTQEEEASDDDDL